jgi:hypothetical protein
MTPALMKDVMRTRLETSVPVILLTAILLFFVGCSGGEWIEVRCPEEHTATRLPRDPATTYRHYGTRYESGFRACEISFDSLITTLRRTDTLKLIATNFRRYLDGERAAVQTQFQSAVTRLEDDPCDNEARKKFQYLVQYVNFNGNFLHKIAAACKDSTMDLMTMLEEYRRERN